MKQQDIELSIQRLLDGEISEEAFAELNTLLETDPKARAIYKRYVRLSSALEVKYTAKKALGESSVVPVDRILRQQRKWVRNLSVGIAAAAIIIGLAALRLHMTQEVAPRPSAAFIVSKGTEFTISHSGDQSESHEYILSEGSQLILTQGCAKVTFSSGVTSIIQAPASITLHQENLLYMDSGKAWFHVPEAGRGFQVKTRELLVTDLGTEFGVVTHPGELDEVHVFKGEVIVENLTGQRNRETLTRNDSRQSRPGGRLSKIKNSAFITKLPNSLPYVHWSFDDIKDGHFHATGTHPDRDLAKAKPPKFDIHALQSQGRYGTAVSFTGIKGQQLRTQLPGIQGDAPRTTACWIRTTYIPIHNKGTDIAGLIGWGYCIDDSKNTPSNAIWKQVLTYPGVLAVSGIGSYSGKTQIADGKWHHLACVMRPPKEHGDHSEILFYVDGKLDSTNRPLKPKHPNTLTNHPLSTAVSIGCSIHRPQTPPIVFRGQIDEVYLFYGALDEASIQNLMRKNHPSRTTQ